MIKDREAIPVRAIPFIAGFGGMSPKKVVAVFAHACSTDDFSYLKSYYWNGGNVSQIFPKEWDPIKKTVDALFDRLAATEIIDGENYQHWFEQSIPLLPPGVFVWKDEFETAFNCSYSRYQRFFISEEREGDRELNYEPMLPKPNLVEIIFEGFRLIGPTLVVSTLDNAEIDGNDMTSVVTDVEVRRTMPKEVAKSKRKRERSEFAQEIINRARKLQTSNFPEIWRDLEIRPPTGFALQKAKRKNARPKFAENGLAGKTYGWDAAKKAFNRAKKAGLLPVNNPAESTA
jgi:hypothetical protein